MDNKMTKAQWKRFAKSLLFRKAQLESDLRDEDYSQVESIAYSKRQQLEAIKTLLEQVPYEFKAG